MRYLDILLFDDQRSNIVSGLVIVFAVSSITIWKLLRPPAPAVHSLRANVLNVKAVNHLHTVFLDIQVHPALFGRFAADVSVKQVASQGSCESHWNHCGEVGFHMEP